ncbi:MAG: phosphatase PAP2 family protein [Bacteroidia bacterium]
MPLNNKMAFSEIVPFYPEWNFDWFILINNEWTNPAAEAILPWLRHKLFWVPLYIFLAFFFVKRHKFNGFWALAACGVSFAISNTLSAEIMKPLFALDRPCNDPNFLDQVILRVNCGPGKSFPSAHATNHFALSFCLITMMWAKYKKAVIPLFLWAAVVSYAQVYVGVHYPVDVLVGGAIGSVIGIGVGLVYNKVFGL